MKYFMGAQYAVNFSSCKGRMLWAGQRTKVHFGKSTEPFALLPMMGNNANGSVA
jgi:hypothetical protein